MRKKSAFCSVFPLLIYTVKTVSNKQYIMESINDLFAVIVLTAASPSSSRKRKTVYSPEAFFHCSFCSHSRWAHPATVFGNKQLQKYMFGACLSENIYICMRYVRIAMGETSFSPFGTSLCLHLPSDWFDRPSRSGSVASALPAELQQAQSDAVSSSARLLLH